MKHPKISVVTVTFNAEKTIKRTVDSLLSQDYNNIEYIIIDGGSNDNTIEILGKDKNRFDKIIIEKDQGIYDAMNKATKVASGDFLIFMNAGDTFFSNNAITKSVMLITNIEALYYGDAIYVNELISEKIWRGGSFSKYRLSKTNICHQTIFYPKYIYKSYSYNLRYKLFADWAYNIQIYKKHKFIYLDQTIAYYDSTGISAINRDLPFEKDQKKLILKHLGFDAILYLLFNKIKTTIFKNNMNK